MCLGSLRATATALVAILLGTGCYRWQMTTLEQQRRDARTETLRLQLVDGTEIVLREGVVSADSVIGQRAGSAAGRVGIVNGRVQDVEARRLDPAISVFFGLGFIIPVVVVVAVATSQTCGAGAAPSC